MSFLSRVQCSVGLLRCFCLDINASFQSFGLFLSPQVLSCFVQNQPKPGQEQDRKSLNFEEPELIPSLTQLHCSNTRDLFLLSHFRRHPMAVEGSLKMGVNWGGFC